MGGPRQLRNRLQDRLIDNRVRDGPLVTGMFGPGRRSLRHHRSAGTLQKYKIFTQNIEKYNVKLNI